MGREYYPTRRKGRDSSEVDFNQNYGFDIHEAVDVGGRRSSLTTTLALHFVQDQNQDDVSPVTTRIKEDEDDGIFHRTKVKPNPLSDISQFSSTLKHSIDKADADTILELLQHKHDHLAQDKDGWCALDYAARTNNEDVCRTRIRSECLQTSQQSIDTYNHTGATPLQFAVSIGRLGTVRVLLEAAANPHATDHYQRSPLFIASEGNHLQVTEFLLSSRVQIPRDATAWLKELLCETNWCNRKMRKPRVTDPFSDDTVPARSQLLSLG